MIHSNAALLLADLHLEARAPERLAALARLLRKMPSHSDVFLLGDLFDVWIGDDDDSPLGDKVATLLASWPGRRFFIAGNRDFLLGEAFAQRCGLQRLDECVVACLCGEPVLLLHGDTLCTEDVLYQQQRAQWRQPSWQSAILARALDERRALAAQLRSESDAHTTAAIGIMDACEKTIDVAFAQHNVARMVHGHTHRPALHRHATGWRHVLPDWPTRPGGLYIDAAGWRSVSVPC